MKVNFYLKPEDPFRKELEALGLEQDPASEYVISRKSQAINYLQVKKADSLYFLDVKDIIYVESMGHDVLVHCKDDIYNSTERLKQLEKMLDSSKFLRISNSVIVNLKQIQRIEASLLQKFILHMSNGDKVDVTRTYYYIFRERLGI